MTNENKMNEMEQEIFNQEISEEELNAVSGVDYMLVKRCVQSWDRPIYEGGFPNCAATVEDGSHCGKNDACYRDAVVYKGLKDCYKAWK